MPPPDRYPDGYPQSRDVVNYLKPLNLTIDESWILTAVPSGIGDFERRTGRDRPGFLARPMTMYYDPPTGRAAAVDFQADLVRARTVTLLGVTKTPNVDYELFPKNAEALKRPYLGLQFRRPVITSLTPDFINGLSIEGDWGYSDTIPPAAWTAMIHSALLLVAPHLMILKAAGMVSWSEAGVSESYGVKPYAGTIEEWRTQIESAAMLYEKKAIG